MLRNFEKQQENFTQEKQAPTTKLTEAFVLWMHQSKNNQFYLSGFTSKQSCGKTQKLIGFFNSQKKNPKEPDIRIYKMDDMGKRDVEVAALWEEVSKKETRYLTGMSGDKEKLAGFYVRNRSENSPHIRVYFKE